MIVIVMLVVPVTATVQYPEEYYTLGVQSQETFTEQFGGLNAGYNWPVLVSSYYELRRQTILLEHQNELLQEQVDLLKRIAPREEIPEGNITITYCNALNTSRCRDHLSNTSGYSAGEHQQQEGGVSEV